MTKINLPPKMAPMLRLALVVLLLWARPAWAVQVHPAPEGLIAHMLGHVLFTAAIVYFLYLLYRHPPGDRPGWKYLKWSLIFFLLWNIDAFTVHALALKIPNEAIYGENIFEARLLPPWNWVKILYYFLSFDHFLCIPEIIFLFLAMRSFYFRGA